MSWSREAPLSQVSVSSKSNSFSKSLGKVFAVLPPCWLGRRDKYGYANFEDFGEYSDLALRAAISLGWVS